MDKEDWRIPESNPQMEYKRPFTKQEALRAKSAMAIAKAGEGDDIPLALLAELPDNADDEFVRILQRDVDARHSAVWMEREPADPSRQTKTRYV